MRSTDRPRYYSALFAPEAQRLDLLALYGFAAEIARVPHQIRDPQLGEIRLQWWLDTLASGSLEAPAIRLIAEVIERRSLPVAPFRAMIEARRADLYADPPSSRTDLEARLGETESAVFQLAALILGGSGPETADASGHAGVAYGLSRQLVRFKEDRARGRTILPLDLLAEEGLTAADAFAPIESAGLKGVLDRATEIAWDHFELARTSVAGLPASLKLAYLPLATTGPLITRLYRMGVEAGAGKAGLSDLESLALIGWSWFRQSRLDRKARP